MNHLKRLFEIDPWKIETHTLHTEDLRLQESLTSIGNGYMGLRGNFEEGFLGNSHQGTYLAGVWYPDKTRVGWWKNGYPEYFGKVINAVNFIAMELYLNGQRVQLAEQQPSDFSMSLDMRSGVLTRSFTVTAADMTVRFTFERFLSIVTKELAVVKLTANVLAGSGQLRVVAKLDNHVHNEDSNYDEMFWEEKQVALGEAPYVTAQTIPNNFDIQQFVVTSRMTNQTVPAVAGEQAAAFLLAQETFDFTVKEQTEITVEKRVAVITSRDVAESAQAAAAEEILQQAAGKDFKELCQEQEAAWQQRWSCADVVIEGDAAAQQGIRFNLFQLFSTYYGEDDRLNIGPKGFTGEKYGGATYWDTEAYAVPLYLALADADVTKKLLKYRHNQLPQAQHNARQQGLAGALYPMVTFTGVECHNEWEITFEEIHRNGAIAYAIYNYVNYTGDTRYLAKEGLEVLSEIARFWADRVHYSKRHGKYMIHGVTGPNEYENNINNNWYTNTIAVWVLSYTLTSYRQHQAETTVQLQETEIAAWQKIIDNMYYPYDEELGVFVQHDTFLDKDLQPVTTLDASQLPLNQNWSWDKILRSCFIKQADVLQGLYFFGDQYSLAEKQRNFDFYEPMTVHESSLSPCLHAILAAEIGQLDKAVEMYQRTARLDLDNYNNDTDDGLHITSMTGSWLAIVQGFAQMKTFGESLSFAPLLPAHWQKYSFHINYRGRLLKIQVAETLQISLINGTPLNVTVYDQPYLVEKTVELPLQK